MKLTNLIILVGSNSVHTHRFVEALANKLNKVIFITNEYTDTPSNVLCYPINFKLNNVFAPKQIANILKTYSKNHQLIVHIHQANSYAYHTIKAIKTNNINAKIILTTWGSDILILPHKNFLFKRLVKYNISHSDIVTSDSLYMSSKIRELIAHDVNIDIRTINFGIKDLPTLCDFTQKDNIILSNRLHKPLYNIDKIISAFARLINHDNFKHYKLVIAGGGSDTALLTKLAIQLNIPQPSIIFTGMIPYQELKKWYKKAKLFVSVPISDACSLSLLEAMAYGCIPILSNLPANLEWVIDGVNGIITQHIELLQDNFIEALGFSDERIMTLVEFNHKLIIQKAQFDNNILEFLRLYNI